VRVLAGDVLTDVSTPVATFCLFKRFAVSMSTKSGVPAGPAGSGCEGFGAAPHINGRGAAGNWVQQQHVKDPKRHKYPHPALHYIGLP
jgi:hypothetical protein